jgi:hypothetical protein
MAHFFVQLHAHEFLNAVREMSRYEYPVSQLLYNLYTHGT